MEIKNLWSVKLSENVSAVINEYGSNLVKFKFDPLAAIEAKNALVQVTFPLEFSPHLRNHSRRKNRSVGEINSGKYLYPQPLLGNSGSSTC